jgi:hypothetical protein
MSRLGKRLINAAKSPETKPIRQCPESQRARRVSRRALRLTLSRWLRAPQIWIASAAPWKRPAPSSSTRTVADPVYAFGSRQSRSGKNERRSLRNEPKFSAVSEAALRATLEFERWWARGGSRKLVGLLRNRARFDAMENLAIVWLECRSTSSSPRKLSKTFGA